MHTELSDELPLYIRKAPRQTKGDPVEVARSLRPLIESKALAGDKQGYLHDDVVKGMVESGLFGLLLPKEYGGMETDPETYIAVTEELSYADSSAGWVFMATTFCLANAAIWLGPSAVKTIFESDAGFIAAGQIAPLGKAERVDGGYLISGVSQFGSGSRFSSWLLGSFVLHKNGKPDLSPEGKPQVVWGFAPRRNVRLRTDTWDVMGLRSTASYDFEFIEQFLPDDFVMFPFQRDRRGGPIFDVGVSMGHVSWALGVGMRILDEMKGLARSKRREGRQTLIDQQLFQKNFGDAAGTVEACRAYVRSAFNKWYAAAKQGPASMEVKMHGRLAACWATEQIAKVGQFAYLAAGSDGLRNNGGNNVLQRCFRDIEAGSPHRHVDHNVLVDCSQVILGINPPNLVF